MKKSHIKTAVKSESEDIFKGLHTNRKGLYTWLFLCYNKPQKNALYTFHKKILKLQTQRKACAIDQKIGESMPIHEFYAKIKFIRHKTFYDSPLYPTFFFINNHSPDHYIHISISFPRVNEIICQKRWGHMLKTIYVYLNSMNQRNFSLHYW